MSTHILVKAETGEVGVITPVQVVTDAGEHERTLAEINPLLDYIEQRAPEDSSIRAFVEQGSTEDTASCITELEALIVGSPVGIREELLWLRECFKEGPSCFMTNAEPAEAQAADKTLIDEVRELKVVAQELLKSDSHAVTVNIPPTEGNITEGIEQPEE